MKRIIIAFMLTLALIGNAEAGAKKYTLYWSGPGTPWLMSDTSAFYNTIIALINANSLNTNPQVGQDLYWAAIDSLGSHKPYFIPPWTLDSTALALYSTRFNRQWFRTGPDSIIVDSVGGVMSGAAGDSVTLRVLWGKSRTVPTDSCADLHVLSFTTGSVNVGTKTIPPEMFVWLKVISKSGAPVSVAIWIDGRRKWY